MREKGFFVSEQRMVVHDAQGHDIIKINEGKGMLVVEHVTVEKLVSTQQQPQKRSERQPVPFGTSELWHERLAHAGKDAIRHILKWSNRGRHWKATR